METKTPTPRTKDKPAPKHTYKTLDEAVRAKAERMEKLFANADWSTLKRP